MAATCPQDGDVVVRSAQGPHSRPTFVLTPIGARWETTCRTYDEAVYAAERTAQVYKSDIWFTKDGVTFELVSSFRVAV
jgi:hypothetical protein